MSDPPGDKQRSPSLIPTAGFSEAELSTPESSEHMAETVGTPKELEPLGEKRVSTEGVESLRDRHLAMPNTIPKDLPVGRTKSVDA